jgi:hypothetical protein
LLMVLPIVSTPADKQGLITALVACSAPDPGVDVIVEYERPEAGAGGAVVDAGASAEGGDVAPVGVDPLAVLESIASGAYASSPSFAQVTRVPYASSAAVGSNVSEWVSTPSEEAYLEISPEIAGSNVVLPVGTTIVRAVLESDGGVKELTVMFKGSPGYNAELGDWWFAVTDADGWPLETDAGSELGKLSGCYSCHIPRAHDGYVFGVPTTDRVGSE